MYIISQLWNEGLRSQVNTQKAKFLYRQLFNEDQSVTRHIGQTDVIVCINCQMRITVDEWPQ